MDQKVTSRCGSNPHEKTLTERLKQVTADEQWRLSAKKCFYGNAKVDIKVPLKVLTKVSGEAAAAAQGCLQRENVNDTQVVQLVTDYVRQAFHQGAAERRMLEAFAQCYINVVRCGRHPCLPSDDRRVVKAPNACDASIELPIGVAPTVSEPFDVVVSMRNGPPSDKRSVYVLHAKKGNRSPRYWYKGRLDPRPDGKWAGEIKHLSGEVGKDNDLAIVAVDPIGVVAIEKVRDKGHRDAGSWDELLGLDSHYVTCASLRVRRGR